ncbi:MAG TPA: hypothetical protein VF984_06645 [Actinomycetota bacterium]
MDTAAGIGLIAGGAAVGLFTASVLWHRLPATAGVAVAATSGAAVGAGALLVERGGGAGDWALAVGVLAVLTPVHLWVLLGRPGVGERG